MTIEETTVFEEVGITMQLDAMHDRIDGLEKMMEEMANAPREEMGKRQPGERCMYERKPNE